MPSPDPIPREVVDRGNEDCEAKGIVEARRGWLDRAKREFLREVQHGQVHDRSGRAHDAEFEKAPLREPHHDRHRHDALRPSFEPAHASTCAFAAGETCPWASISRALPITWAGVI